MTETIVLKRKTKEQFITINFEGTTFNLPLGGSVPFVTLQKLKTDSGVTEFLEQYVPADLMATLTSDDIAQIFTVWNDETAKSQGLTVGESQASEGS